MGIALIGAATARIHRLQHRDYPGFERLFRRPDVATQASEMSCPASDGRGRFEYNGASGKSRIGNALAAGPAFVLDALRARGFERR